jgi:ATP-dependent RNA helicase DeaD
MLPAIAIICGLAYIDSLEQQPTINGKVLYKSKWFRPYKNKKTQLPSKYYEKAGDLNAGDSRNSDHGKYSRLFISLGEKDGFYKAAFLEFLLDTTGHTKAQLGKIELMDAYSFVEVEKDIVQEFMTAFEGKKFRGRQIKIEVSTERSGGGRNNRGGWGGGGGRDRDRGRGNGGGNGGGGERRFENRGRSGGGNSGGGNSGGGGGGYDRSKKRRSY